MGSALNRGMQNIQFQFHDPLSSMEFNQRSQHITPVGIYAGGLLSKIDDVSVKVSPWIAEIGDGTYQVRATARESFNVFGVSSATPFIVLRWTYSAVHDWFVDVLPVAEEGILANDLVLGRAVYVGAIMQSIFDYTRRSITLAMQEFLRAEPTSPPSMRLRVKGGWCSYLDKRLLVTNQDSPLFVAPTTNPRIDILWVDETGALRVTQGVEAPVPVSPSYTGKLVLAEVLLQTTSTTIIAGMITDSRSFVNLGSTVENVLTAHGDILFRDAVGLQRLPAGSLGQVLTTQGPNMNPFWGAGGPGAGGTGGGFAITLNFEGGVRQTIVHGLASAHVLVQVRDSAGLVIIPDEIDIVDVNTITVRLVTSEVGVTVVCLGAIGGVAPAHTLDNPSVHTDVQPITEVQGQLLFVDSALKWNALAPGTSGHVLTTRGPGATPVWSPPPAPGAILRPYEGGFANNTTFQAPTDGFVVAIVSSWHGVALEGYCDPTSPTNTVRVSNRSHSMNEFIFASVVFPVPRNWFWRVQGHAALVVPTTAISWVPLF